MPYYDEKHKTWRAEIMLSGKRIRKRGFTSKKNAAIYEAQQRAKYERELLNLPTKDDTEIEQVFQKYMPYAREYKTPKAARRDESCLNIWREFFNYSHIRYMCEIEKDTAKKFVEWRNTRLTSRGTLPSKRTVNIDLMTLRHVFTWAVEQGIIKENPLQQVPLYKQQDLLPPHYLTKEEILTIESLSEDFIKADQRKATFFPAFSILVRTGMRAGELCSLEIRNVDFERSQILLFPKQTKSSRMRRVPFGDKIREILTALVEEAEKNGREYLICSSSGNQQTANNLNRRFRNILNVLERRGVMKNTKDIHIHTLRSTYISHRIMQGADPVKVMAIVGHEDWSTFKRYLVLSPQYISDDGNELPY